MAGRKTRIGNLRKSAGGRENGLEKRRTEAHRMEEHLQEHSRLIRDHGTLLEFIHLERTLETYRSFKDVTAHHDKGDTLKLMESMTRLQRLKIPRAIKRRLLWSYADFIVDAIKENSGKKITSPQERRELVMNLLSKFKRK